MADKLTYGEYSRQFLGQLPKGAFLTVKCGDRLNTMTIGWGSIGYLWNKPVLTVMVRYSRYTHELIDKCQDFSVSLPAAGELKKSLAIAGNKSGRDTDKFMDANLTAQNAKYIDSPVIGECELIFECRLIFKQVMDPDNLDASMRTAYYPEGDYHVMYYGEILSCYEQAHK